MEKRLSFWQMMLKQFKTYMQKKKKKEQKNLLENQLKWIIDLNGKI